MNSNERITAVVGFSRCGTSLMMRMLDVGGLPCVADNKASYEDNRADAFTNDLSWLGECQGKAVKILEPQRMTIPSEFQYDFIWMRRDPAEQGKSQAKFLRHVVRFPICPGDWKALAKGIARETGPAIEKLRQMPGARLLVVNFEKLLKHTEGTCFEIAHFLGRELNQTKMREEVRPRDTRNYPGFLELEFADRV